MQTVSNGDNMYMKSVSKKRKHKKKYFKMSAAENVTLSAKSKGILKPLIALSTVST